MSTGCKVKGRLNDVTDAAAATAATLTDSTGGTASDTLAAITAGGTYAQADMTATKNALASLAAQVNALIADAALIRTAVNACTDV